MDTGQNQNRLHTAIIINLLWFFPVILSAITGNEEILFISSLGQIAVMAQALFFLPRQARRRMKNIKEGRANHALIKEIAEIGK